MAEYSENRQSIHPETRLMGLTSVLQEDVFADITVFIPD